MKIKNLLLILFASIAFISAINLISAETNISACGVISSAGTYILNQTLTSTGDCISINISDVALDCNNNLINSSTTAAGLGINASSVNNITIKNCRMEQKAGGAYGIYFKNAANSTILNNTIMQYAHYNLIYLDSSTRNQIINNTIINGGTSATIYTYASSYTNIIGNIINSIASSTISATRAQPGILLDRESNLTLKNNNISVNNSNAIWIYADNLGQANHSIDATNNADGKPINFTYGLQNAVIENINNNYGQFILSGCNNVTTRNSNFSLDGLSLFRTSNSTIISNNITTSTGLGLMMFGSSGVGFPSYNSIVNNTIYSTTPTSVGLDMQAEIGDNITTNQITTTGYNSYALSIRGSPNSTIFNNTIMQAYSGSDGAYFSAIFQSDYPWREGEGWKIDSNIINVTGAATSIDSAIYELVKGYSLTNNKITATSVYGGGIGSLGRFVNSVISNNVLAIKSGIDILSENNNLTFINNTIISGSTATAVLSIRSTLSTNVTLIDCVLNATVAGTNETQFLNDSTGIITFINTTLANKRISFIGTTTGIVYTNWYLDTYTNTSYGLPLQNVNISIIRNDGVIVASLLTNSTGSIARQNLLESVKNATLNTFYTNYTINLTKAGYTSRSIPLNITHSLFRAYTLSGTPPNINFVSPTPENNSGKSIEFQINASITEQTTAENQYTRLNNVIYNWNGTNYTIFNDTSLVFMMNLDNISAIGENDAKAVDASQFSNNGTVVNTTSWTPNGKFNGAYQFNGVNNSIRIADTNTLDVCTNYQPCSFSVWIKPYMNNTQQRYLTHWGQSNTGFIFQITGAAALQFLMGDGATNSFSCGAACYINSNIWVHIALTYNGSVFRTYVNGINIANDTVSWNISAPTFPMRIGDGLTESNTPFNGSIDEVRIYNRTLSPEEINILYNSSFNVVKYTPNQWLVYVNQTGLQVGNSYTYQLFAADTAGNSNSTEIRIVKGNSIPSFVSVSYSPTTLDKLDPNVTITLLTNLSDTDNNFDSAIFQWKNSSALEWINATMANITAKSFYTLWNISFTPSYEYQDNYTYRIWINDTEGEVAVYNGTNISVFWDCTWLFNQSNLGQAAGFDAVRFVGYLNVSNTGDPLYPNNNCALGLRFTYNKPQPKIYFDNSYLKPSNTYTINARENLSILLNATFEDELFEEIVTITGEDVFSRSSNLSLNASITLISSSGGPYLFQSIASTPSSTYLTYNNFSLEAYVRNIMGDDSINNSAYNVSFNWSLPSNFLVEDGSASITFANLSNSSAIYNDINITFNSTNLPSLSPGIVTVYIYSQGYNSSDNVIVHTNNRTLLSEQANITLSCYNVSDGILVTACGSLDGDYVTPLPEEAAAKGGGGGGGGNIIETVQTSADFQLVRGKQNEIKVPFKNRNENLSLKNINFTVSGNIAKYIEVIPPYLTELLPLGQINITLRITSPTYIQIGRQQINLNIRGQLGDKIYDETKRITLEIHELSKEEAELLLNKSENLMAELKDKNISSVYLDSLLNESQNKILLFDFEKVQSNYNIISKEVAEALGAKSIIEELETLMQQAKEKGIDVSNSERILKLAILALNRGEFELAFARAKEAQVTYALETKGEIGKLTYYLRNYPREISLSTVLIVLFSFVSYTATKIQLLKNRIKKLKEEEAILSELMKAVQKETFESKTMSMEEYGQAMLQFEKRLSSVIEEIINLESKRIHMLKFGGAQKTLEAEKSRLIELIKQIQEDYFEKRKIETRSYEIRVESYNRRIGEIEERIATLEAKAALRKSLGFFGSLNLFKKVKGESKI